MLWVMRTNPIQKALSSGEVVLLALTGTCTSLLGSWPAKPVVQPCPESLVQAYGSCLPPVATTLSSHSFPRGAKMAAVAPALCHIYKAEGTSFSEILFWLSISV